MLIDVEGWGNKDLRSWVVFVNIFAVRQAVDIGCHC